MVTKYYCDDCGLEFSDKRELSSISLVITEWNGYTFEKKPLKSWPDRCKSCKDKVLAEAGVVVIPK